MGKKEVSLRTPLGRARGLGSARDGVHHWMMVRLTSIPLIPLFFYFLCHVENMAARKQADFIVWLSDPVTGLAAIFFIVCGFYHAALGMQEIIEDYVHAKGWKILLNAVNKFAFLFLGIASIYAVLYINLILVGNVAQ